MNIIKLITGFLLFYLFVSLHTAAPQVPIVVLNGTNFIDYRVLNTNFYWLNWGIGSNASSGGSWGSVSGAVTEAAFSWPAVSGAVTAAASSWPAVSSAVMPAASSWPAVSSAVMPAAASWPAA